MEKKTNAPRSPLTLAHYLFFIPIFVKNVTVDPFVPQLIIFLTPDPSRSRVA